MKKIELLAPAGDLEKLKIAIDYGADAVYFGGEMFSLRSGAGNLSIDDISEGVEYAHSRGKKCYLTVNIYAHNEDLEPFYSYLERIKHINLDAFIVSEPGVMMIVKEIIPNAEIHLSTQANTTNLKTAEFWYRQGVKRVVIAREMTIDEIREFHAGLPDDMEIESFVHGAMCISYSGRCLLSNFMIERDANRGECAHPCRWKYSLVEEKRSGEYFPIEEDARGTYIMNSRDLCMIEHMKELIEVGVVSAKIEGRMKSVFYVATVVSAYRKAIDTYYENPLNYAVNPSWLAEVQKVSHREFTTGFYFHKPSNSDQNYLTSAYTREYDFVGLVKEYYPDEKIALVEQRNKMVIGDEIEIFGPNTDFFTQKLDFMTDVEGQPLEAAPHAQQMLKIKVTEDVSKGFILRKKK